MVVGCLFLSRCIVIALRYGAHDALVDITSAAWREAAAFEFEICRCTLAHAWVCMLFMRTAGVERISKIALENITG